MMRIIEGTTDFRIEEETAVAIGKFDGLHVGHQALLKAVMKHKKQGLKVAIFTFWPSPACVFSKGKYKELTTREEKRQIFRQAGIDILVEFPFNEQSASIAADDFIEEILINKMHAKYIVAGEDVSYGHRGAGDAALLYKMSEELGYQVEIIEKVRFSGREISSTYVRDVIRRGDMKLATTLLGTPFHINGVISHGKQLGRTLGMPTANLYPEEEKLLPPYGVYFVRADIGGVKYKGICNIGERPTVTDEKRISVETYLYDFSGNIYGKEMKVELLEFKRPEQRFSGVDALKKQMEKDIAEGAVYQYMEPRIS